MVLFNTTDPYFINSLFFNEETTLINIPNDKLNSIDITLERLGKTVGNSYYVSTSGSDFNTGALESPWRTIQKAADMVTQGDTVYIRGGIYREKITLSYVKGTSTSWITFKPYNSESVVVDASGLSGRYDGIFLFKDSCSYIRITGLEIKGANNYGVFLYGGEITNIRIDHCVIHDCESSGIYCYSGSYGSGKYVRNVEFDYNTVYDVNNGLSAYAESVSPQEAISFSNVQGFNIHHNTLRSFGKEGIDCKSGSSYGQVHHNFINTTNYPIFSWGDWNHIGIYIDGFNRKNYDIQVYNNFIIGYGGSGIVIGAEETGGSIENIRIFNNVICLSYNANSGVNYRSFDSFVDNPWKDVYLYGNTFYSTSSTCSRIFPHATNIENLVIINNIFAGYSYHSISFQYIRSTEATDRITFTNNLFYRYGGISHNKWYDGEDKSWGVNPIIDEPKFANQNAFDLHLQSNSPAIDTGHHIEVLAVDFDGNFRPQGVAMDIGAYEYHSRNNPPNKPITPSGQENGAIDESYSYESTTIDIDGDPIYYLFDWGDGTDSGWIGPYESGKICTKLHMWTAKGIYEIKVKAKDITGEESPWSDSLPIIMPYTDNLFLHICQWLIERFPNAIPLLRFLLQL